jgi:hypothetical protein
MGCSDPCAGPDWHRGHMHHWSDSYAPYEPDANDLIASTPVVSGFQRLALAGHWCSVEAHGSGQGHSASLDHLRRLETFRTAMATAFFCPTNTTRRLPRVTPV